MKKSNNPNDKFMMTKKKGFLKKADMNKEEIAKLEKKFPPKRPVLNSLKDMKASPKPTSKKLQLKMRTKK